MTRASRRVAGIILVVFPSVIWGGVTLLGMLIGEPSYMENPLRQDLWRAGHANAGVLLILSLVALRYVDEARLGDGAKNLVRWSIPSAAIFLPIAYFLSMISPDATEPSAIINLAYVGAAALVVGLVTLGFGLLRHGAQPQR